MRLADVNLAVVSGKHFLFLVNFLDQPEIATGS